MGVFSTISVIEPLSWDEVPLTHFCREVWVGWFRSSTSVSTAAVVNDGHVGPQLQTEIAFQDALTLCYRSGMRAFSIAVISCLLLIAAFPVHAATSYKLRRSRTGVGQGTRTFLVIADGERMRATAIKDDASPEPQVYDSLLVRKGLPTIALNSQNATWYELESSALFALASQYLVRFSEEPVLRKVVIRNDQPVRNAEGEQVYRGRFSYDEILTFWNEKVPVSYEFVYEVTTTEALSREQWIGRILPQTFHPSIDEVLVRADASIVGFPRHLSLVSTRQYKGGPKMTGTMSIDASRLADVRSDNAMFKVPSDYIQQRPLIGVPGK